MVLVVFGSIFIGVGVTKVEASVESDYKAAEVEGKKLLKAYESFTKTVKTGKMETIDQEFYKYSNAVKATEIKINKVNSSSKKKQLKTTYLNKSNALKDSVIYSISGYRSLVLVDRLIDDKATQKQAIKEYGKVANFKKQSAKKVNGLNKNAIAQIKALDTSVSKQIAKIERSNQVIAKPKDFIDPNAPRVKLNKYYFTLVADSKVTKEEVKKYTEFAEIATENLINEFGYLADVEGILADIPVTIHVQDTSDSNAGIGLWSVSSYNTRADIYLLAQSAHKTICCTSTGDNFDDAYFKTTMVHEMSSLVFDGVVKAKSTGWRSIFGVPAWFHEGYNEYIGVKYNNNVKKLDKMIDNVIENKTIQFEKDKIKVSNEYKDGLVLLYFLHDKYGIDAVHSVLKSTEPTFEKALAKEIGDNDKLKKDFEAWINKK